MWARLSGNCPWRTWFIATGKKQDSIMEMIKEGFRTLKSDLTDIESI